MGSFLAFYLRFYGKRVDNWGGELLSFLGLFLILFSIIFFDRTTPYPSIFTLAPVLGTGFLILASSDTIIQKLLRFKVIVGLGLISYSAYLWHQPVFAFAHMTGNSSSSFLYFVLIFVSLFLAYLSWRFVEKPFRNYAGMSRKTIFTYSAFSILFFISLGILFSSSNGFANRSPSYLEVRQGLVWSDADNRTDE